MERLVNQDAFEIAAPQQYRGIEKNQSARDGRRGQVSAQRAAKLDTNGTTH